MENKKINKRGDQMDNQGEILLLEGIKPYVYIIVGKRNSNNGGGYLHCLTINNYVNGYEAQNTYVPQREYDKVKIGDAVRINRNFSGQVYVKKESA